MADISDDVDNWSATAASNSPSGSTTIGTGLDDNLRAIQAAVKAWKDSVDPYSHRNHLINGDFKVAQRGTSFTSTGSANNDDTYNLDRWYLLADGNDIVDITQESSTIPTNGLYAIALDVETANKKFGIAQIVEQKNCKGLIGGAVTLSFKAKVSATTKLDNVKAAIIAWDGTADTVTSDVVSAWGNEGTNPTLVANCTYENTPANLSVTTSYATYSVTATVDTSNAKNIIVFIWSDVTDTTAGDFLYITDVQLEPGSVATEFEQRDIAHDVLACKRYVQKSYDLSIAPGAVTDTNAHATVAINTADAYDFGRVRFEFEMRSTPTVTLYSPADGATGNAYNLTSASNIATTSRNVGNKGFELQASGGSWTANQALRVHYLASSEL